jgi:hypothetical protein
MTSLGADRIENTASNSYSTADCVRCLVMALVLLRVALPLPSTGSPFLLWANVPQYIFCSWSIDAVSNSRYIASNDWVTVNNKVGSMWKERFMPQGMVLPSRLPGRSEEKRGRSQSGSGHLGRYCGICRIQVHIMIFWTTFTNGNYAQK